MSTVKISHLSSTSARTCVYKLRCLSPFEEFSSMQIYACRPATAAGDSSAASSSHAPPEGPPSPGTLAAVAAMRSWAEGADSVPLPDTPTRGQWELAQYGNQHHLVREVHAGAYGRFHKAIAPLKTTFSMEDFQLPRLIVIGSQHVGKSSLLESITKCPIFPRATHVQQRGSSETTTRAPVCLHMEHVADSRDMLISVKFEPKDGVHVDETLQNESEIVEVVQRIMDSIDDETILSDEVVVTIRSPAMTTIEFVDVPGIVESSVTKKRATEKLVQRYLADPRNLILSVEQADFASLGSSPAVGRVNIAGRANQAILVLTKADLVDTTKLQQLWERVSRQTAGSLVYRDFFGCIAVISSSHHAQVALLDAAPHEVENKTFERVVFSRNPRMPQLMHLLPSRLKLNLTIPNLIIQVEGMYRRYIIDHWQEDAQALLKPKVAAAKSALDGLGLPVDKLTVPDVVHAIWYHLDWPKMVQQLYDESANHDWIIHTAPDTADTSQTLRELAATLPDHPHQTMEHMQQLKQAATTAFSGIERWLEQADYLRIIEANIMQVFEGHRGEDRYYRLQRFHSLKQEIIQQGLRRMVDTQQIKLDLLASLKRIADMLRLNLRPGSGCLHDMEQAARAAIVQEVFLPLQDKKIFIAAVPADFDLEESPADQQRRKEAMTNLSNLAHALNVIDNIHLQVDQILVNPATTGGAGEVSAFELDGLSRP